MVSSKTPSASGKGKNLKQGTLFSFFSKKPGSADPKSTKSVARTTTSDITPAAAKTSSVTPPSSSAASSQPSSSPTCEIQQPWQQVEVGMRIAVYWKDDRQYYNAKVTARKSSRKSEVTLRYDDGEVECLDLATETFRILKDDEEPAKKKRRVGPHDESDEELEFEDDIEDKDDDEAYEDRSESEDEEDVEEAKQWVKDDEDEDVFIDTDEEEEKKPKKRTTNNKVKVTHVTPSTSTKTPAPRKLDSKFSSLTPTPSSKQTPRPSLSESLHSAASSETGAPMPYVDGQCNSAGSHVHNHLKFLRNPTDSKGLSPTDPDYDPHTLKVDWEELKRHITVSQAVEQWWNIKSQYFDTVLLFKTGKFYEMFHMDADIGVNLLEFQYMKGKIAHAGFPEVSYGPFSERLVQAGYKVARVEQTETPDQLAERKKRTTGKKPQVVNREVCSILSLGTRTFCYLDDASALDGTGLKASRPLLAIREILLEQEGVSGNGDQVRPVCEYGITMVDAARAVISIGQFADDVLRSRMHTLLTSCEPSEILLEAGENGASKTLHSLVESYKNSSRAPITVEKIGDSISFPKSTALNPDIRRKLERQTTYINPWDVQETLDEVHRKAYFPRASRKDTESKNITRWPKILQAVIEGEADLALSSFGAVLYHLQRNLIDREILSMGSISAYIPSAQLEMPSASLSDQTTQEELDLVPPMTPAAPEPRDPHMQFEGAQVDIAEEAQINHMTLDGTTLQNLEILTNSKTHTTSGSLWSKINFTKTPHGSRMLRAWLLRPLFRVDDIARRADAVEELVSGSAASALSEARQILAKCGDIERLLSRIHSMSGSGSSEDTGAVHPNERAVLYESATHTRRKVGDFSKLLNGLRQSARIPELFDGIELQSGLLRKIVYPVSKGGYFPEMDRELDWFFQNFDCELAAKGFFEPGRGMDDDYDEACDAIERIRRELEDYKDEMCSQVLRGSSRTQWKYINTKDDSKDKYFIELPASIPVPDNFIVKGKRGKGAKQVNKYRTREVEQLIQQLEHALDVQKDGKARGMQLIFAKFDSKRSLWAAAAQTTAMLDAVGSLAQASSNPGFTRPTIIPCPLDAKPCIHFVQGRHPCVEITHTGGQFIPNDLTLGEYEQQGSRVSLSERVLLLSGPNMGGKSTLLRQTCILAILAQIGCFVPAEECALTPVDRIFTRLGASDRILLGQSTFFVELAETASALRGATRRSLVIMDELGRGTSTFDGTAIASACVQHLVQQNQCLTLFATHYHSLLSEWQEEPVVRLGHMECQVENGIGHENEDSSENNDKDHNITFLYTLGEGPCPKSFGINVAKLAGLPDEVLSRAKHTSSIFEKEMNSAGSTINADKADEICASLISSFEAGDDDQIMNVWHMLQR